MLTFLVCHTDTTHAQSLLSLVNFTCLSSSSASSFLGIKSKYLYFFKGIQYIFAVRDKTFCKRKEELCELEAWEDEVIFMIIHLIFFS